MVSVGFVFQRSMIAQSSPQHRADAHTWHTSSSFLCPQPPIPPTLHPLLLRASSVLPTRVLCVYARASVSVLGLVVVVVVVTAVA
jgi:hypothetical protein